MVFSWEYLAIFSKTSKEFFLPSLSCEDKKLKGESYGLAERNAFWHGSSRAIKMPQISLAAILIQARKSSCTLQGLGPWYSTTLSTTCWVQELGSKCAEKSHEEGCGWENWLAHAVLQHTATELSLHGSHCEHLPQQVKKKVYVRG